MNYRNLKRKASTNGAFSFFVKYFWIIPVAFLLAWALPTLKRLMDDQEQKTKENNLENNHKQSAAENNKVDPTIQKTKSEAISKKYPLVTAEKMKVLNTSAQLIAKSFGTNPEDNHKPFNGLFNFFNVAAWVEDESTAIRELKKHPGTFSILSELYYQVYTKNCNLKTDCYKYLSEDNLNEVRKTHLKYGNYHNL